MPDRAITCDLSRIPAGSDFFYFVTMAATEGYKHVIFDDSNGRGRKWSPQETGQRIATMLEPACALAGLTYSWGAGNGVHGDFGEMRLLDCYRKHGRLRLLESVRPPVPGGYTVTLRENTRHPEFDTNAPAWRAFARRIGARVIEGWRLEPMPLHERMALYAGAEMNFTIARGFAALLSVTGYAYHIVTNYAGFGKLSTTAAQVPWAMGPHQRLFHGNDTEANLMSIADAMDIA